MTHDELQHGIEWDGRMAIRFNGCSVSEKLDGVRALWNGQRLISRQGKVIAAPAWFTDKLPAGQVLDGEIYAEGHGHDFVNGVIKSKADRWNEVEFIAFDAPEAAGDWFERIATVKGCAVVEHFRCSSLTELRMALELIDLHGGEGVMIREKGGYEAGRNFGIIKAYCNRMADYGF